MTTHTDPTLSTHHGHGPCRRGIRNRAAASGRIAGLAGVLLVVLSGTAAGQNAQGDGRQLDGNQQQGAGRTIPATRADFSAESRFRSAIVTGNAPNGLSFRSDVGYASEREFRGEVTSEELFEFQGGLASDDIFMFRRDSLYSGLSGLGIRGTDALQYQFALTTGNRPPPELAGALTVSRDAFLSISPAVQSTAAAIESTRPSPAAAPVMRAPAEELAMLSGAGMWRLRSPSAFTAERSLAESIVGTVTTGEGQTIGITASPLGGIRQLVTNEPGVTFEATAAAQRLREGAQLASASNAAPSNLAPSPAALPGVGFEGYLLDLERAAEGSEAEEGVPTTADRIREQNRILSDFLRELREQPQPTDPTVPGAQPGIQPGIQPGAEPEGNPDDDGDSSSGTGDSVIDRLRDLGVEDTTIDALRGDALRGDALRIDRFVDDARGVDRTFYAVHMAEGRRQMSGGSFFSAEARFALALSLRPDDATASIARVHAQIGAGLFLSAAMNLRETLTANPLLLGARYADDLIPDRERLSLVAERLADQSDGAGAEARSAALLLAYVGWHLGDEALIEQGLSRLEFEGGDNLTRLMRVVWLEGQADDDGSDGE
ncbi:MAG: hypothetical protein AAGF47_00470 [Planctomycetota bacterium]